jgi:hypothetical protein
VLRCRGKNLPDVVANRLRIGKHHLERANNEACTGRDRVQDLRQGDGAGEVDGVVCDF